MLILYLPELSTGLFKPHNEHKPEVCDATAVEKSNKAGLKKRKNLFVFNMPCGYY